MAVVDSSGQFTLPEAGAVSAASGFNPYVTAGAIGSQALKYAFGSISANSANSSAKKNALTQFWMQNYFMDKMNEYNKPVNQMKRLAEANLNPALVYGNQNAVISSASPSGGAYAPVAKNSEDLGLLAAIGQAQTVAESQARIDNLEAQTARTITQTDIDVLAYGLKEGLTEAQIKSILVNAHRTQLDNDFYEFLNQYTGNSGGAGMNAIKVIGGLVGALARK
uniref:DNA pilot protein n=1 Tax=Dulem virus 94 TaxID=3145805 RepID=A0AAU8B039_9VIRU